MDGAMVRIETIGPTDWHNYHRTIERHVADHRRLRAAPAPDAETPEVLAATADALMALLAEASATPVAVLAVGGGWSFSDVLGHAGLQLETRGADVIGNIETHQRVDGATTPLVLAGGGTSIAALNDFLEGEALSLFTSGSHNGQTVAGALATGIHGSAVDFGAFQNHVRGLHLITGPDTSIWLERGPDPVLDPAYVRRFAREIRRDADLFEAALVHLGGLGIVNAVLLEVAPGFLVDVVKRKRVMTRAQVRELAAGHFESFARTVWPATPTRPYYVEVTLNPFFPFGEDTLIDRPALVTLYFKQPHGDPDRRHYRAADDVTNLLARAPIEDLFPLPHLVPEVVAMMFEQSPKNRRPPARKTWGEANGAHEWPSIGGIEVEFALFNAAYAVPRARLAEALDVMLAGFAENGGGHLVFTLRFVARSDGLLAFTRFPDSVVINLDGLRTPQSERAARDVALALERADIPFSQHWGKQGAITANRVARDFGGDADPASPAARWRAARAALVPAPMRSVLGNDALRRWGLI